MEVNEEQICRMLMSESTRREAFRLIVRSYSECLYRKVRYIVLSHEDADDVLQNTFMKAWNNIDSFRNKSKLLTWLYSIAINEALDYLRKNKGRVLSSVPSDEGTVANQLLADGFFDGDKAQAMLLEAVSRLPEVQRTVFNMRYFDNMKYSEISRILNTSEGALKASYHIAVRKITEYLDLKE